MDVKCYFAERLSVFWAKGNGVAPVVAGGQARRVSTKRLHFINKIPMLWATRAASIVSPVSAILFAIRYMNGFAPGKPFEMTLSRMTLGLVSLDTARRAVHRLEQQQLIRVERRPGRKLRITVLEVG